MCFRAFLGSYTALFRAADVGLESHYSELTRMIAEVGKDVKPAYTNSKASTDRLRKSEACMHACTLSQRTLSACRRYYPFFPSVYWVRGGSFELLTLKRISRSVLCDWV